MKPYKQLHRFERESFRGGGIGGGEADVPARGLVVDDGLQYAFARFDRQSVSQDAVVGTQRTNLELLRSNMQQKFYICRKCA